MISISLILAGSLVRSHVSESNHFFDVQTASGRSAFVTPSGVKFWSFGVCCVDQGTPREKYDPKNPSYRAWALFDSEKAWATDSVAKLRSWGFNTLGGWSDYTAFSKLPTEKRMPYTVVLHLGAYYRAPWDDLFSKEAKVEILKAAKAQIEPIKDDPYLIGYFSDNELGWWDDTVFLNYVQKLPAASAGRKAAHAMLRRLYGSFDNFKKEWITTNTSWEDFAAAPNLFLRPESGGIRAVNAWMSTIGDYYYRTVNQAIRTYDKRHLILGDRYQQYYNVALAKSSSKWIDVCSTNMGSDWTNGTFSHFYLDTLNKITKKPILITEFYMCAMENRSGNKNSSAGFPTVQTQKERATAFGENVRRLGALPYILGAHWFQYTDEPEHGRGDGENFNMGMLDTKGVPYEEITSVAKSIKIPEILNTPPTSRRQSGLVPSVEFDPMATPSVKAWPRDKSLVLPTSGDAFADMYVVQDKDAVYVSLYAMDYADQSLYQGGGIPESERQHWTLKVGSKVIDIRFGGDKGKGKPLPLKLIGSGIQSVEKPDLKHTIILRVPKSVLRSNSGQLAIESQLSSHSAAEVMRWKANLCLSPPDSQKESR
jgi:hypothetical protein